MKRLYSKYLVCIVFISFFTPSLLLARPEIILVSVPVKKIEDSLTSRVLTELQIALKKNSWSSTQFLSKSTSDKNQALTLPLVLEKAANLQLHFKDAEAIKLIESNLSLVLDNEPTLESLNHLADAYLFLAFCYKNLGQSHHMNIALSEAARLNPSLIPNELQFPPSLIASFARAKDQIWKHGSFSKFSVDSQPAKAKVFLNGQYKGVTPLRVEKHPVGEHYLFVQWKNKSAYKKLTLKQQEHPELILKPSSTQLASSSNKKNLFALSDLDQQYEWLDLLTPATSSRIVVGLSLIPQKKKHLFSLLIIREHKGKDWLLEFDKHSSPMFMAQKASELVLGFLKNQ